MRNVYNILFGKPERKFHLEDLGVRKLDLDQAKEFWESYHAK
jgi:hypothetical protein